MSQTPKKPLSLARREFLKLSAVSTVGAVGGLGSGCAAGPQAAAGLQGPGPTAGVRSSHRSFNEPYRGEFLNRVAFPMGGIGAGMICLEGSGALSHVSLRHRPEVFHEPCIFAAIALRGQPAAARVLEGPVPGWKLFGGPGAGNGAAGSSFGLPRFSQAQFEARFPFGKVTLRDGRVPLQVSLTGWSPFEPGDADNSSLPVAALEYHFTNPTQAPLEAVFSFNAKNFMALEEHPAAVRPAQGGFILWSSGPKDKPWEEGAFSATVTEPQAKVNTAWFRGGWWDALTMAWNDVAQAACFERGPLSSGAPSPGATLFVPFELAPGASKTIVVRLAWYVGQTKLRLGKEPLNPGPAPSQPGDYQPWYSQRFSEINSVNFYWRDHYEQLRQNSGRFSDCFYESSLPAELLEAVAANLTILKSPTVLRQADGRLWGWEGCGDNGGCCHGSCTHVWNYAQAIPHLFPSLERSLRETEFGASQNAAGHQQFRSSLPIRPVAHDFHAAADGQLGGILKVYRDWRISGDTSWLSGLWPKVKQSLDFCIETWDPTHQGLVLEPHHNTYDIEFWGPEAMCTSFYLGALQAAVLMGKALEQDVALYSELLQMGQAQAEASLFNGEFFFQKIQWQGLRAKNPLEDEKQAGGYSAEARTIFEKEGPKYQYGTGCLSDGVLGSWLALVCGVGPVLDQQKVASHLRSVHRYNFKSDLSDFANPQRPSYACGAEAGLLLCTWPKGGALSLPFVYSNEVWTGIEYQVASHLMRLGMAAQGLEIVRACRARYNGRVRNPFNEYECGHWYARAMASYALLFGWSGARYDAVEKILYLEPAVKGDFQSFFCAASSYGLVGVKKGKPFYQPKAGALELRDLKYTPYKEPFLKQQPSTA